MSPSTIPKQLHTPNKIATENKKTVLLSKAIIFFISPFLFASCTNASTFSKWCDGRRGWERGTHQHPSVIRGAKPGAEVGNSNTY
jgi:hypothetical protein